jgi:integrase
MTKREYGEGTIYRRGDRWHVAYHHRGRLYRESSKSTNRRDAVRLLSKRLAEIHSGRLAPAAEKVTLADLRELVETEYQRNGRKGLPRMRLAFDRIEGYFAPETRAVDITADRLSDYHRSRLEAGAAPATVSLEFSALKRGFSLAVQAGRLHTKPVFPVVRVSNARQGWPTPDDLARLLPELKPHVRSVIRFAAITGWRIKSEILPMRWSQVTDDEIRLEVGTTKSGAGRAWPLKAHREVAAIIAEQRAYVEDLQRKLGAVIPWVFPRPDGRQIKSFDRGFRAAAKRAKVNLIPHDLRRGAARNLERAGVPRGVAMELCGWKTEAMYRRYNVVAHSDLAEGVAKLAAYQGATPSQTGASPKAEA